MREESLLIAVMAGGFGKRIWPLSSEVLPKQFLDFDKSGLTLFQKTILRAREVSKNLLVICNFTHRFIVLDQLRIISLDEELEKTIYIICEPFAKNTLAVGTLAAIFAQKQGFERVLLMPSDQIIQKNAIFLDAINSLDENLSAIQDGILAFGVAPNSAYTGYGYIKKTDDSIGNSIFRAGKFVEKPNQKLADLYFKSKNYLWNCGIFLFFTDFFISVLEKFEQETLKFARQSFEKCENKNQIFLLNEEVFNKILPNSIDFAIIQRLEDVFYIDISDCGWIDLGSFEKIYDFSQKDPCGNVSDEFVKLKNVSNSHVINRTNNPIILDGVRDLRVVAMQNVLLITKK